MIFFSILNYIFLFVKSFKSNCIRLFHNNQLVWNPSLVALIFYIKHSIVIEFLLFYFVKDKLVRLNVRLKSGQDLKPRRDAKDNIQFYHYGRGPLAIMKLNRCVFNVLSTKFKIKRSKINLNHIIISPS